MYNPEKCVRIPRDSRAGVACLWLASLILLTHDAIDQPKVLGLESVWGVFLGLVACSWTCAILHAYSRRVVLEVMSYEHRQQMAGREVTPPLQAVPE